MSLPKEYVDELNVLNKDIAQQQPTDVLQFCANYFNRRLEENRKELLTKSSSSFGAGWSAGSPGAANDQDPAASKADGQFASFNTHSFSNGDPTTRAPASDDKNVDPDDPSAPRAPATSAPSESSPFGSLAGGVRSFPTNFTRRTSVSAESLNPHSFAGASAASIPEKPLDPEQLQRLNASVSKNFLFSNLDEDSLHLLLHALQEKRVPAGTTIIKQGDEGDFYYIVESGSVEFYKGDEKVGANGSGSSFGELALMYNAPRAVTVVAATDTVLWALDRMTFKKILLDKTTQKRSMYGDFLREVPILKVLSPYELSKMADALQARTYAPGDVIIEEGATGDEFFLIESGEAIVTKQGLGQVQKLGKGDYFGEVALLHDTPRQATVAASSRLKVATLGRSGFQRLLGPVVEILRQRDPTLHAQATAGVSS